MSSLRTKPFAVTTAFVAIVAAVAMSGGASTSASVENGNRRIDIQFSNLGDQDVGGIAVTDDGTVIVAGATDDDFAGESASFEDDGLLFATNQSGEIEWARIAAGTSEVADDQIEFFNDVIVHSNGDIYVVGQFDGDESVGGGDGFDGQAVIEQYSPSGALRDRYLWGDVGDAGWDEAQSLVEGSDGNLYVVGYSEFGFGGHTVVGDNDAFVLVLEPDLDVVDTNWLPNFGDDRAYSITFDDDDNFYIAGRSRDPLSPVFDWYVTKMEADGDPVWTRFGGDDPALGEDGDDRAWDVVYSESDDSIWVAGYRGNAQYDPDDPGVFSQVGFFSQLNSTTGDDLLALTNQLADSEGKSVAVDSRGHPVVAWSIDGSLPYNFDYSGGRFLGGRDSGISHDPGISPDDYWDGYFTTTDDDEIMNMTIDDSGNLWLVGETSGDFAASNGGDDDIFLSLYRVRDPRRTSRSNNNSASWSVLSGTDRFDSSLAVSRTSPEGGSVILVNGRNQVDLLLASMLDSARAESIDGRILLVEAGATQVPESLRIEWERLAPSAVTVIGGPDSVSDEFLAAVANGSVPTTRVQASQVMARILDSSVAGTSLVLVGDDEPTNALQAVSWANVVGGTVLPLSAALYEIDRLKSIGFSSVTLVGSPDVNGLGALAFIESSLGLTAQKVTSASPSDQSAAMAAVVGSRPDVAVVSPTHWVDAVHANAMRLPLIWAGPECVQPGATAALASLSPTNSIRGFGGAIATLGDPRSALRC